jgi:hypothetical protein
MQAVAIRCTEATAILLGAKPPSTLDAAERGKLLMLVHAVDTLSLFVMPMSEKLLDELARRR